MKSLFFFFFLIATVFSACACSNNDETKPEPDKPKKDEYTNPVVNYSLPDPTIIKAQDGLFYLYATEDIRNTPIHKSSDLVNWEYVATAFTENTRPTFEPNGGLWAPDINYFNGQYVMYYSMSVWGGEWTCGIGVAAASKPQGPFTDQGKLFCSNEIDVQNSIDPFYIEEDSVKYLFWGSFRGIYAIALSEDGLSIKPGAEKQQIAGTAYEGTYIYKKDDFYYLFASIGSCCNGINSTYTTAVGRSENLMGPYHDKSGGAMMNNQHEVLIKGNSRFVGTGHNAEIVTDANNDDWILYHAVDKLKPEGRVLMLDILKWNNGWPSVATDSPALGGVPKPKFQNKFHVQYLSENY